MRNRYIEGQENKVRDALRSHLAAGESLVEFCDGKYSTGIWGSQEFWIGLTERRLLLIKPRKTWQVFSIQLAYISGITVSNVSKRNLKQNLHISWRGLEPEVAAKADLSFAVLNNWAARAAKIAELCSQTTSTLETESVILPVSTVPEFVELVEELQKMGVHKEAQALFFARIETDPFLETDLNAQALRHQMNEGKLAMRVASIIYGVVILFFVYLAVIGKAMLGFGIILAIAAMVDMLRGNSNARASALFLALFTVGLNLILNIIAKSPVDIIAWTSFGVAMSLLLIGRPSRLRIELGGSIFALGAVGVFLLLFFGARYFPDQVRWLMPPVSNAPLVEKFNSIDGWAVANTDNVASNWENGAYYLSVKKPGKVYFSFPPLGYFPDKGEVDAQVSANDSSAVNGYFGMICRYQKDTQKYYLIYVDPYKDRFLVDRIDGENELILTSPKWLPVTGIKDVSQTNRIGLECHDNQIQLTLNGVQQAAIQDPEMAQFGAGKMGMMVATSSQVPAEGYKVMFDNASFWPAGQ